MNSLKKYIKHSSFTDATYELCCNVIAVAIKMDKIWIMFSILFVTCDHFVVSNYTNLSIQVIGI